MQNRGCRETYRDSAHHEQKQREFHRWQCVLDLNQRIEVRILHTNTT
jgi:hypothetical protein